MIVKRTKGLVVTFRGWYLTWVPLGHICRGRNTFPCTLPPVSNYRPIYLLPSFAKIERIVFKNLYLKSNNLITKNQSGFTPGDSGTNQLISLIHGIHQAFDDNGSLEVRSVYLDMSKAFDKVWHEGLLYKLRQNGIEGNVLKSYNKTRQGYNKTGQLFESVRHF